MEDRIRVVVIDDHLVSREGIVSLISRNPRIDVVAEGWAGNHVVELLDEYKPDVLLTDLQMPAYADGRKTMLFEPVRTFQKVLHEHPRTAIIVISQEHDVSTIQNLAEVGVKGYFLKTDNFTRSLGTAVEQIQQGMMYFSPDVQEIILAAPKIARETRLTEQQKNVLRAVFRSPEASRAELAASMHISPSTLQKHINTIFATLEVPNMVACVFKAMRMGLIEVGSEMAN